MSKRGVIQLLRSYNVFFVQLPANRPFEMKLTNTLLKDSLVNKPKFVAGVEVWQWIYGWMCPLNISTNKNDSKIMIPWGDPPIGIIF